MDTPIELTIILPCLNEELSLGLCLDKLKAIIEAQNLRAEIIVVDNGSTDRSPQIASEKNVVLLQEPSRGYGAAYLKGFSAARGEIIFMADSDGSYDFNELPRFIDALKNGYDFVLGNRFAGTIDPQAMPWLNRFIGNPLLSGILRLFFHTHIHDAHCGMRAITKKAFDKLQLRTRGMEFASEMVIMAIKKELRIKELPINYHKRTGQSKLKTFEDGWRHLRFMLLYSPLFLFFLPGLTLFLLGLILFFGIYSDSLAIGNIRFYYHPLFFAAILIIIGYQLIIFALFAKTYAITHLGDKPVLNRLYKYITIEKAGIAGMLLGVIGTSIYGGIFIKWISSDFGALQEVKNAMVALLFITVGIQTLFASFMLSILSIKGK